MPSKGQRVAKLQSQLRRRRKRDAQQEYDFDVGPEVSQTPDDVDEDQEASPTSPSIASSTTSSGSNRRRHRKEQEDAVVISSPFLGGELRHIGIMSFVVLCLLAAAAFDLNAY